MSAPHPATHIREAVLGDAEVIIEFNRRLAAETEDKALDPERLANGVRAALSSADWCLYFVAEADGQVVGQTMVTFEWSDWRNGWFWWIQSVYVHPEFRRRGIFRALHDHVRKRARSRGDTCGIRLYVEHENHAAQQTYRDLGMVPSGHLVFEEDWSSDDSPGR
jgi:GNAT superfamily N-acetyltransferase